MGRRMPGMEPTIAIQIEGQPLKLSAHIAQFITAASEHFQPGVASFNKPAGLMLREMGTWRSSRARSVPCCPVRVAPQRRQQMLVRGRSAVRMSSSARVISV